MKRLSDYSHWLIRNTLRRGDHHPVVEACYDNIWKHDYNQSGSLESWRKKLNELEESADTIGDALARGWDNAQVEEVE